MRPPHSASRVWSPESPHSPQWPRGPTWRGLPAEQDVDILLVDAPQGLLEDARLLSLLDDAPCDVAVVVGDRSDIKGPVLVPFSGFEHDWAAVELGAWFAQALECPIAARGPEHRPGRSRREPVACQRLARAAEGARRAGRPADRRARTGSARRRGPRLRSCRRRSHGALATRGTGRRSNRPGHDSRTDHARSPAGLATRRARPQTSETRFTWTVGPSG